MTELAVTNDNNDEGAVTAISSAKTQPSDVRDKQTVDSPAVACRRAIARCNNFCIDSKQRKCGI